MFALGPSTDLAQMRPKARSSSIFEPSFRANNFNFRTSSEPATRPFSGVARRTVACRAVARGQKPAFARVGFGAAAFSRFASEGWWACLDSNQEPDRYERPALTIELQAPPRAAARDGRQRCRHRLQGRPRWGNAAGCYALWRALVAGVCARCLTGKSPRCARVIWPAVRWLISLAISDYRKLSLTPGPKQAYCNSVPSHQGAARDRHETRGGMRWTWMRF